LPMWSPSGPTATRAAPLQSPTDLASAKAHNRPCSRIRPDGRSKKWPVARAVVTNRPSCALDRVKFARHPCPDDPAGPLRPLGGINSRDPVTEQDVQGARKVIKRAAAPARSAVAPQGRRLGLPVTGHRGPEGGRVVGSLPRKASLAP
jgi:hypothetical protein